MRVTKAVNAISQHAAYTPVKCVCVSLRPSLAARVPATKMIYYLLEERHACGKVFLVELMRNAPADRAELSPLLYTVVKVSTTRVSLPTIQVWGPVYVVLMMKVIQEVTCHYRH